MTEVTNYIERDGIKPLNRAQRRNAVKKNPACRNCGILWNNRYNEWSACTVHSPPTLMATGHDFPHE